MLDLYFGKAEVRFAFLGRGFGPELTLRRGRGMGTGTSKDRDGGRGTSRVQVRVRVRVRVQVRAGKAVREGPGVVVEVGPGGRGMMAHRAHMGGVHA